MNDRDCDNCVHHTCGSCSVWECSFEQKEDDTISRRATIVALCGECQGNCIPCEHFPCGEIKAVQALPPAQPEVRTQMSSADCISRQAAIDIFDDYNVSVENGDLEAYSRDRKRLCELPSAQPDIAEKLYLCKCYVTDEEGLQHEVIHTGDIRRVTGWEI